MLPLAPRKDASVVRRGQTRRLWIHAVGIVARRSRYCAEKKTTLCHSLVAARRKPSGEPLGQTGCFHLSFSKDFRVICESFTPKQHPPFTVAQQELEPSHRVARKLNVVLSRTS